MIYRFADLALDLRRYELRRGAEVIAVEPKVFDVLRYLVEHSDRVVSKQELLREVWPQDVVTQAVLPNNVAVLRKLLGQKKGERQPIETIHGRGYRFTATVTRQGADGSGSGLDPLRSPSARREPFVGRRGLLRRLRSLLDQASRGRGRFVLLTGPAGIGKTRALEELAADASSTGARLWSGRAHAREGAPPFWPWIQVLRSAGRDRDTGRFRSGTLEALQLAEIQLGDSGEIHAPPTVDEAGSDFRVHDAVTRFLVRAAEEAPVVLSLDDLHAADASSLSLLAFLVTEIADSAIFVIAASRHLELPADHPGSQALASLVRPRIAERIELSPLSREAVEHYLTELADTAPPASLVDTVHDLSEGNPFYVRELVQQLLDERGAIVLEPPAELAVPEVVRDVIRRELASLSSADCRVLSVAAVIGREFELAVLRRVVVEQPGDLLDALDRLQRHCVIEQRSDRVGRYRFVHGLIRRTLYDDLSTVERLRLHRAVGDALAAHHGEADGSCLAALAHHYTNALPGEGVERAVEVAERAALHASRESDHDEAARLHGLALQAMESTGRRDMSARCKLMLRRADALTAAGRADAALAGIEDAVEAGRQLRHPGLFVEAVLALDMHARLFLAGAAPVAGHDRGDNLEEALHRVPAGPRRARLLARLAVVRSAERSRASRGRMCDEAMQAAGADASARLEALFARLILFDAPTDADACLEVADQIHDLTSPRTQAGTSPTARYFRLEAHVARTAVYLARGECFAADKEMALASRLSETQRWPMAMLRVQAYRAARALAVGSVSRLSLEADVLHELSARIPSPQAEWLDLVLREALIRCRGEARVAATESTLDRLLERLGWIDPSVAVGLARWALNVGLEHRARRLFESLAAGDLAAPGGRAGVWTLTVMAELALGLKDAERAEWLRVVLLPHATLQAVDLNFVSNGVVAQHLGALARFACDADAAVAHYEQAVALHDEMGLRFWLAESRQSLGATLCENGSRRSGEQLMAEATALRRELGLSVPGAWGVAASAAN